MPLGRRIVPYLLLGALTLGAGLGVGLGLSEESVTHKAAAATSLWAPCATARNATGTTVTCGSVVADVTPASFTYGSQGFEHFYEPPDSHGLCDLHDFGADPRRTEDHNDFGRQAQPKDGRHLRDM